MTRRVRAKEEFRARKIGARAAAAAAKKRIEILDIDGALSPMSQLKADHREELRKKDAALLLARTKNKPRKPAARAKRKTTTTSRRVSSRKKQVVDYADHESDL